MRSRLGRRVLVFLVAALATGAAAGSSSGVGASRSPGGTILFNSWRNGGPGLWYTVRGDGSGYRVVPGVARIVRLSPDARTLAFGCQGASLCLAAANGSHRRLLVRGAAGVSAVASHDWSPEGRRIVYINRLGVWLTKLQGSKRVRIAAGRHRGFGQYGPVGWSPRGGWIGFMGRGRDARPAGHLARIYLVRPNGTGLHVVGDFPYSGRRLSWSSDDRRFTLAVPSRDYRHTLVLVVDARTGARHVIARGVNPAFSPDGTRIAFVGESGGLRVVSSSGGRSRRIASAYYGFVWSPQGDRIAFDCCDGRSLLAIDLDGGGRQRLARTRYNDVGRGGELQWVAG